MAGKLDVKNEMGEEFWIDILWVITHTHTHKDKYHTKFYLHLCTG